MRGAIAIHGTVCIVIIPITWSVAVIVGRAIIVIAVMERMLSLIVPSLRTTRADVVAAAKITLIVA